VVLQHNTTLFGGFSKSLKSQTSILTYKSSVNLFKTSYG